MEHKSDYDEYIQLRIPSGDKKRIIERMRDAEITNMSAYMRKMAIDGYIIVLDLSDIKEVLRLLNIAGNNLNQYARQANTDGSIYANDMKNLQISFDEINDCMKQILVKLSRLY
ncbi:MAG: MobC family plasmid mobilization relaxosome protein [Lachnospiraceae bacterium]|nr:MobC family plasmid mobilization relaxosome protein [Lachnospiraceae bacterium]